MPTYLTLLFEGSYNEEDDVYLFEGKLYRVVEEWSEAYGSGFVVQEV